MSALVGLRVAAIPRTMIPLVGAIIGHRNRDAGQQRRHLASAHVGHIAVGIHRHGVFHVVGVPLQRDGGGTTLALTTDGKRAELVHSAGEIEISAGNRAGQKMGSA